MSRKTPNEPSRPDKNAESEANGSQKKARLENDLEEGLEQSFPASDPPSASEPGIRMSERNSIDAVDESSARSGNGFDKHEWRNGRNSNMNLKELADRLDVLDEDAFVSLLQLEYTHDGEPGQVKAMMIDALRFANAHGMKTAQPPLDSAD